MSNVKFGIYTKAIAAFEAAKQKTVTPTELSAALGTEAPASKHAWFLKSLGFSIQANKDGRNVVSYTMLSAPAVAPVVKVAAAKPAKKVKAAPVAKPAKVATATATPTMAAKKPKAKSPTARKTKVTAEAAMTDLELKNEAAQIDFEDVGELDDRMDLPEGLR